MSEGGLIEYVLGGGGGEDGGERSRLQPREICGSIPQGLQLAIQFGERLVFND